MYQVSKSFELFLQLAGLAVFILIAYAFRYIYVERRQDCPKCGSRWSLRLSDNSRGPRSEELMADGLRHTVCMRFETYSCARCGHSEDRKSLVIDEE